MRSLFMSLAILALFALTPTQAQAKVDCTSEGYTCKDGYECTWVDKDRMHTCVKKEEPKNGKPEFYTYRMCTTPLYRKCNTKQCRQAVPAQCEKLFPGCMKVYEDAQEACIQAIEISKKELAEDGSSGVFYEELEALQYKCSYPKNMNLCSMPYSKYEAMLKKEKKK
ncbi:MAG: hypothetical protein ABIH21_04820 [Patescibacteria group bacterium]